MKSVWLPALLSIFVCSCNHKGASDSRSVEKPGGGIGSEDVVRSEKTPLTATPEQIGSVVRVRVAFGGLPPRDAIGALLHRDEIPNRSVANGNHRFVITLLRGWKEAQVINPNARFIVYRNKVGADGRNVAFTYSSHLVQFDPATGLAILHYLDSFDYEVDAGFHLEAREISRTDFEVLRTSTAPEISADIQNQDPPAPAVPVPEATPAPMTPGRLAPADINAQMQQSRQLWEHRMAEMSHQISNPTLQRMSTAAFIVDAGEYFGRGTVGRFQWPAPVSRAAADKVFLATAAPDKFLGFIDQASDGAPRITDLRSFSLQIKVPEINVSSVTFTAQNGFVGVCVHIENLSEDSAPKFVSILTAGSSSTTLAEAAKVREDGSFAPINSHPASTYQYPAKDGVSTSLGQIAAGDEKTLLLQISWPIFGADSVNSPAYGKPFLVRLRGMPDGVYPTVEGLPEGSIASTASFGGPSASSAAGHFPKSPASANSQSAPEATSEGPVAQFALEAPVRSVHLMAGGREALFELERSPYWKRFSFEKNVWLPLAVGDLSNAFLTGNLSALFVLDRGAGEVRKYLLPGLQASGTVKLPASVEYAAILAGCNSEHAPLHVLSSEGSLALAPETLRRRDFSPSAGHIAGSSQDSRNFSRTSKYSVTGDGLCISQKTASAESRSRFYNSDALGLENRYFDLHFDSGGTLHGVSAGYSYNSTSHLVCSALPGGKASELRMPPPMGREVSVTLAENSPIIFRLTAPIESAPPIPARVTCFSYFDPTPIAIVNTPELAEARLSPASEAAVFFDPHSFRLGTVAPDRKTWFVHTLVRPPKLDQPVLLNWPDTSAERGSEFRFRPLLLGGNKFVAEIDGKPGKANVGADGAIRCAIDPYEVDSLQLLNLKISGEMGKDILCPISFSIPGPELPIVANSGVTLENFNTRGAGFKTLGRPTNAFRALSAMTYSFRDQIVDIQGPVSGCAALVTVANRVDFLSLESRKITGAIAFSPGACFYAGSGALFEYDPGKRTLTRISVPDGRREIAITLPPNVTVAGIGIGTDRGSPVSLALNVAQNQEITRFSDLTITSTNFRNLFIVLDGNTLRGSGWTQPVSLGKMLNKPDLANPFNAIITQPGRKPPALPAAHSGCIVTLPNSLLVLSPGYAVYVPMGNGDMNNFLFSGGLPPSGSISGLMAASADGQIFKGGIKIPHSFPWSPLGATSCGRYQMVRLQRTSTADECLEVRLAENGYVLFHAGRFTTFQEDPFVTVAQPIVRRLTSLGDDGPLAILSASGKTLQIVNFNIPEIMKGLEPSDFHVISQPAPIVMEGGMMQYQVRVNNPEAVKSIRLQGQTPGAGISPQGLLRYTAPSNITGPTQANIAIEIEGKNGNVLLHEFTIFVLPQRRLSEPPKIGPI